MRTFTPQDIDHKGLPCVFTEDHHKDLVDCPLWFHKLNLQQTASGYGAKLTTVWKISFDSGNGKPKLYRVFCTQYGNAGSCWFMLKGEKIYVN
jgi:hypothetical protein